MTTPAQTMLELADDTIAVASNGNIWHLRSRDSIEAYRKAGYTVYELAALSSPAAPAETTDGQETYYTEGKNAEYFEKLNDADFAWRITRASQDIVDNDFGPIEQWMPITAMLDSAAKRITTLSAPADGRGADAPVQDTWFVDRRLPIMAMAGDIEDDRALKLIFRRKVSDEDRARLIEVLNAGETALASAPVTEGREALKPIENEIAREIDQLDEYIVQHCQGDTPAKIHARTIAEGRKLQAHMDLILVSRALASKPEAGETRE